MDKILEEVAAAMPDFASLDGNLQRAVEHIQSCGARGHKNRLSLIWAMACLACEVAEMDDEVERGKYLEQARALLVAGHAAGFKYLRVTHGEAQISLADAYSAMFYICANLNADPAPALVELLAEVLRKRAAKR